jgi:hypothetical protein
MHIEITDVITVPGQTTPFGVIPPHQQQIKMSFDIPSTNDAVAIPPAPSPI